MTGVEVLGALASTAQIAFYVIQTSSMIVEQVERLRNAPIKFQQHSETVTQLIGIAQVVQSNQWLQTESMTSLLKGILERVEEVHKLLPKIQKNDTATRPGFVVTYWKAFRSLKKEERIQALFAGLEEQKSTLALCILEIQTRYTGETSCNLTKLLPMVGSIQEDVSHIRRGTGDSSPTISSNRSIVTTSDITNYPTTPTSSTLTQQDSLSALTRTPHPLDREVESPTTAGRELTLVESPTTITALSPSPPLPLSANHFGQHLTHTYDNPLAHGAATQINGDIGIGASAGTQAHRYSRPMADGESVQMNGNISGWDVEVWRMVMGRA